MAVFPVRQTPRTLPGLIMWLDGTDPLGTGIQPANNAQVVTWVDKSGFSNSPTMATGAKQPLFTQNAQNGNSCLSFDGVDDELNKNGGNVDLLNPDTGGLTYFLVMKATGSTANFVFTKGHTNTSTNKLGYSIIANGSTNETMEAGTATVNLTKSNNIAIPESSANIYCAVFTGSTLDHYKNGSSFGAQSSYSETINSGNGFNLGSRGGSLYTQVQVFEFIVYKRALSASEQLLINRYLGNKYGVVTP